MGKLYRKESSEIKLIIVVATDEEYKLAKKRFNKTIIQTGVGGTNIIQKLRKIPKWIKILNIGYAGSNKLEIGTEVKVGECQLYHPNVEYKERIYKLNGQTKCFTSNDFIIQTEVKEPCVFDMELAYILALGFKNVESTKIVSDNLSLKEYKENI